MLGTQLNTVRQFYSQAQSIEDVFQKAAKAARDTGINPSKTVYCTSFCSDELNNIQFPWGDGFAPFILGGLGGYPFGGLTGMGAFAAHVPSDGIAVIFYGPHIGITGDGVIGKINRIGQEGTTGCCGSLTAAVRQLLSGNIKKDEVSVEDHQQNTIEQLLLKEENRIINAQQQVLEAVDVVYGAIDVRIEQLISQTAFPCKNIIKAGGIFINSDKNERAFWAPRLFEVV